MGSAVGANHVKLTFAIMYFKKNKGKKTSSVEHSLPVLYEYMWMGRLYISANAWISTLLPYTLKDQTTNQHGALK